MALQDKTVLVPGASRPIGRAIAKKFGDQGATLILPVFDWPDSIEEMKNEFKELSFNSHVIQVDLRKESDVTSLTSLIRQETGRLDYLINNIERGGMPIVHGGYDQPHNAGQWETEIDTTLKAKWLLFRHCLPLLRSSPAGSVLNISSIAGITGRSGPGAVFFNDAYSAANRAVDSFTELWAREGAPNIRVNGLVLGLIESRHGENTRGWASLSDGEKAEIYESILLNRTGQPAEVAETVYFLSVLATYMTGSITKMDGGFTLGATKVPPMPKGIL
ncbi:MAG: 3-oxoacyl-[acyl-carrier protein] reductase [Desulforhopalus sp.]|jgi:3-oxoacyl-[acyl-carrier protein] reductase